MNVPPTLAPTLTPLVVTLTPPPAATATSMPTATTVAATATRPVVTVAPTLVATSPTPAPSATPTRVTGPGTQTVDPALFDAQRAYRHVQVLAGDIGKRVAGTDGNKRGAEYIRQQFEAAGLQVEMQPFPVRSFEEKRVSFSLTAPQARDFNAQAMIYSSSGQITAPIVAVPNLGRPEDYRNLDIRGKIALVKRGELLLSDKVKHAADQGAAAVVLYNTEPQGFTGTLREQSAIPAIAVSGETGQALLTLLKNGAVTAALDIETEIAERQGANIVGRRPGNDQVLIFGGHMDSVPAGPGANDNASGTAIVLELARILAQSNLPQTLVFVGFDAEESGLIGSRAYVHGLSEAQRKQVRAMFNFDMLGATDSQLLFIGSPELTKQAATSAAAQGINGRPGELGSGGSDHQSFIDAGIPAVFFFRDDPLFHTPQDTPDRVRPEHLAASARTALGMLQNMTKDE